MKKMLCRLISTSLFIVLTSVIVVPAHMESPTALSEKARQAADAIVSDYGAASVQYAIIDHGDIVLSGSSGVFDKAENRVITKDDMYGIGSTSKMFLATSAMMLWDQGLIELDKPLIEYIPEFSMLDERFRQITPRMLLNHSSGINGTSQGNSMLFDDSDPLMHDTLLSQLSRQRLKAAPGQFSEYCNDGFTLLEILVERVSGMRYKDFLSENILKPLSLLNTMTPQDSFVRESRLVKTYVPHYIGALPADTVNALGSGGLYSTAEDLCQFTRVLMGKRPDLLSEQATLLMQNEEYKSGMWVEAENGNFIGEYGLGWDTVHGFPFRDYGIQALAKGGDTQLFHSSLVAIPALDIAMAAVSSGGASIIDYAFAAGILQEYLMEKGIIREIAPLKSFSAPLQAEMPKELEAYSGFYVNAAASAMVEVKDGTLRVSHPGSVAEDQWIYAGEQGFISEDGSSVRSFSRQTDGEIYLMRSQTISLPKVGQAVMAALEFQQVEPASPEDAALEAWEPRAGKRYYVISEKPSSQTYLVGADSLFISLNDDFSNGFAYAGTKVVDKNHAANTVKFRDVADLAFIAREGVEYLDSNSMLFIREDFIPELTASVSSALIGEEGFAQYYVIGSDVQGKTLTVGLPKGAAYAVYDENHSCVNFTTVSKNNTTVLPASGKIVLIGKTGDVFDITLQ